MQKAHFSTSRLIVRISIIVMCSFVSIAPVYAAAIETAPPTSKCVTTKTLKLKADYEARMNKELVPHLENQALEDSVKRYREELAIAWAAMQEPYCGFGSYGSASAVKSYTKSVIRARDAFLTKLNVSKTKPAPRPAPTPTAIIKAAAPSAVSRLTIRPGLTRGMRSDLIMELQRRLDVPVTGFFGPMTENAIIQFQIKHKIISNKEAPGAGMVGPKTAAALSAL